MKKYRVVNKKRFVVAISIMIMLVSTIAMLIVNATADDPYLYIDTGHWYVSKGNTLWSIAELHSNDQHDTRKVIEIIKELNNKTNSTIYAGETLIVPLFENMNWTYHNEYDERLLEGKFVEDWQ